MGTVARYSVTSGLAGCYMPDNCGGPREFTRRTDLADAIRYEIEFQEWPASCIKQVKLTDLWKFIKHNGSSSAHFAIHHKQYVIEFHGLTEDEYNQQVAEDDQR
jgi:hypothetical protein